MAVEELRRRLCRVQEQLARKVDRGRRGHESGKKSTATGERYLPKDAREALSPAEYAATTAKKRRDTAKGRQFSRQPEAIAKKTAAYRDGSPPKEELIRKARSIGIKGRSAMTKGELSSAIASRWRGPSAGASRAGTTRP
jgi:hypothetical protein